MIGTLLCGLASSYRFLLVARIVTGVFGGVVGSVGLAIVADLFPPRERGRFAGLFGSVFGFASAIGPLIGGYFTDHGTVTLFGHVVAGWRWVFYLNLPVGLVALFMVIARMPVLGHARKGRIDFAGAALIVTAFVPLLRMVAETSKPRVPSAADGAIDTSMTLRFGISFPFAASMNTTSGITSPFGVGTFGGGASSRIDGVVRSLRTKIFFPSSGLSPSAFAAALMQAVTSAGR